VGSKYTKARTYYGALMVPHSTFGAESNSIHKIKRARLNPMFSRRQVLELEDVVQGTVAKVVRLTRAAEAAGQPVDLHHMFRCVSVDVISEYAFDRSYALLDTPDLGAHFFAMVRGIGPAMWFFQQFPPLRDVALTIPLGVMERYMGPAMRQVATLQREAVARLEGVRDSMAARKLPAERPTIFSELLDPEKQSGFPVPPLDELKDEVYGVLAAAADTTGNAMTVAAYKVLSNPQIYQTLRKELLDAFPEPDARLEFTKLEKLPYLVRYHRPSFA
jgi:cytochrome P450